MNEASCYKANGRIYFRQKDIPSKKKVMKTLGVKKKKFAGNMISRMYDYYFQGAINFRREYRKYYRKEFCSLEKFIEEHFNIECDNERNIETLNYDEYFKNAFSKAVGGLEDEDKDGVYYE